MNKSAEMSEKGSTEKKSASNSVTESTNQSDTQAQANSKG